MEEVNNNNLRQLELSSDVYRAIIDALSENAIFSVTDEKGDIAYANKKFVEVSKYPLEELLGQNHRIMKSGHQPQEVFDDLWATISGGKIWYGEIKNRAKDGTYYWVEATIVPIFNKEGKIINYAALRIVINKKKETEEKDKAHVVELERMNKFIVDRELKMVELKDEVKRLEDQLATCRNREHLG